MIQINSFNPLKSHYVRIAKQKVIMMSRKKVPKKLFDSASRAAENIFRYEPIERYVIDRVVQASKQDVTVDEVFIKLANKILYQQPVYAYNNQKKVIYRQAI